MNVTQYRRIYHNHMKKCGGTTINRWLDTLTLDERTFDTHWTGPWRNATDLPPTRAARYAYEASHARAAFHWSDVVHSHAVLRPYAPAGTFCFTILREPVARVISQVMDWRRLRPADAAQEIPEIRECLQDCSRLPLGAFLKRHGHAGGQVMLDNYMVRALADGRIGRAGVAVMDPGNILDIALQSLEEDYDFVGITEQLELSRNAVCALVGLPPVARLSPLNVSRRAPNSSDEIDEARDILEDLTRFDRIVYDRACQLFEARHRAMAEAHDVAAFEARHAARRLGELRGAHHKGATIYSVRQPLVGSGFHGRDAAGTPACAVWTGPDPRATLYIPTPPNMALSLLVWILGYAAERQRGQLGVWVNGRPAVHYFEPAEGYADLLTVDLVTSEDFVRLELDVGEAVESGEPGSELYDPRQRGICFGAYGWRPCIEVELDTPDANANRPETGLAASDICPEMEENMSC